jgi:hypothetical protein
MDVPRVRHELVPDEREPVAPRTDCRDERRRRVPCEAPRFAGGPSHVVEWLKVDFVLLPVGVVAVRLSASRPSRRTQPTRVHVRPSRHSGSRSCLPLAPGGSPVRLRVPGYQTIGPIRPDPFQPDSRSRRKRFFHRPRARRDCARSGRALTAICSNAVDHLSSRGQASRSSRRLPPFHTRRRQGWNRQPEHPVRRRWQCPS